MNCLSQQGTEKETYCYYANAFAQQVFCSIHYLFPHYRACARGGQTKRALNLLQVVKDKGLPLDTYIYTAVIDGKNGAIYECRLVSLVLTLYCGCLFYLLG